MKTLKRLSCVIPEVIKRGFPLQKKVSTLKCLSFIPIALCTVYKEESLKKLEFQAPKTLTNEYLIKQASSVTVNAASQLLTQTVVAILDTAEDYKKSLLDLMSLLRESKEILGNDGFQQELSDLIIASRAKSNDFKNQLLELDTLLIYVEKVVISTAETSFLAGAEFVSTTLSERLHSAKLQVDEVMKNIKLLENEFLGLQKDVIYETCEYEDRSKV